MGTDYEHLIYRTENTNGKLIFVEILNITSI